MKRQEKGRGKLDIRVLFTLAAIAEILGTLLIATLLTALLENLLHETIEVHPLVWLLLFGTTIGLTAATVVNVLLLRTVVRLSRAMKQVASGNFAVRLTTNSVINEIADSYDSFNRMVEALGETETLQTDFVSNVSHEIKTPVSAIEGYTTLLQSTDVSPEQAGYIERILLLQCLQASLRHRERIVRKSDLLCLRVFFKHREIVHIAETVCVLLD